MSGDIVYCVCRSSDGSGFMIGCDNCDEWYHGACISMNEQLAMTFFKFYCLKCRDRDPSLKNQFYKQSTEYKYTITSSEVTSKQGTVRKKSPSPQRSNKVTRYEDTRCNIKLEKRDYENEADDDQDETLRKKNDSSEKNKRKSKLKSRESRKKANSTPVDNEWANEKIDREREKEISKIDKGLRQCYQWMNEYTFLSWRGLML
uniref:PHD-type domain-containing protein n=1 Tax=Tetranychus urticae TaxID=32264 RepID=T1KQM8_TETUR